MLHKKTFSRIFLILAISFSTISFAKAAAGDLDLTFNGTGKMTTLVGSGGAPSDFAFQTDGKIVSVGTATIGSSNDFAIVRYNLNGTLDTSFGNDGIATVSIASTTDAAYSVAIQSDGKIVAAGYSDAGAFADFSMVRLNSDGSLDTTFDTDGKITTSLGNSNSEYITSISIQNDGKILATGISGLNFDYNILRYNSNGSLDTTFDADGIVQIAVGGISDSPKSIQIQNDGKIVVGGTSGSGFSLIRLNVNGSLDTSFDLDGKVTLTVGQNNRGGEVFLQNDGKILVGGGSISNSGGREFAVVRFNSNGSLDTTFDTDGIVTTPFDIDHAANSISQGLDGKISIAGSGTSGDWVMVKYLSNGAIDTTFDGDGIKVIDMGGTDVAQAVNTDSSGRTVIVGRANSQFGIARLQGDIAPNSNGALDTTFDGDGIQTAFSGNCEGKAVTVQPDQKIVVAGWCHNGTDNDFAVARFNPNGTLDTTFSGDGMVTSSILPGNEQAFAVTMQGTQILVGGYITDLGKAIAAVARYNSDGTLDTNFGGDDNGFYLANYSTGNSFVSSLGVQSNGRIVLAGDAWNGANYDFFVARSTVDGNHDLTFNGNGYQYIDFGGSTDVGYSVDIRNGKIVVGGTATGNNFPALARLNESNGALDTTFDSDGKWQTNNFLNVAPFSSVKILSDNKILWGGTIGGIRQGAILRIPATGGTFDGSMGFGQMRYLNGMAFQSDGKLAAAGYWDDPNNSANGLAYNFSVARVNSDLTLDNTLIGELSNLWGSAGYTITDFGLSVNLTNDVANAVAVQTDDKVIAAGTSNGRFALARYISLAPSAANVSVAGRITSNNGSGIPRVRVSLTKADGVILTATTNAFGYYSFENLESGQTYVLQANSKRFEFQNNPRVLTVSENLESEDFTVLGGAELKSGK